MKEGQTLPRREDKSLHPEAKARVGDLVFTTRLCPEDPLFLHGTKDFIQIKRLFLANNPLEDSSTTIVPYKPTSGTDAQVDGINV